MEYKDVLALYMARAGLTMTELAARAGVPKSSINELLKGRTKEPTLGRAKAIADALGAPLEEMASMLYEGR